VGDGGQEVIFAIYYRASDGEILGWTNQSDPVAPDGMNLAVFDEPFQPEPLNEKFDVMASAVVEKTAEERRLSRLPKLYEVQQAVFAELSRTDHLMMPDHPNRGGDRHAWLIYRQMLRDLSRLAGPADMINDWTLPPDGIDPITALRERLS
jgi:hypothetical protein